MGFAIDIDIHPEILGVRIRRAPGSPATPHKETLMKALCLVVLCASSLGLLGSVAHAQPAQASAAEALGLAMADAVEKSADCRALGPNLDAALASQKAAIQTLSTAKAPNGGSVSAENQKRLLAMANKVKGCVGQVKSPALDNLRTALAAYGRKTKPVELASEQWCEDNCCIKGWETWAAVAFFSAACLAGDHQACCLATTLASYDACVETYCPTNDCCQDVPPGGPPN
jgi:hypothetical protein